MTVSRFRFSYGEQSKNMLIVQDLRAKRRLKLYSEVFVCMLSFSEKKEVFVWVCLYMSEMSEINFLFEVLLGKP
jgi:hypothetical protein